jgi:uncharacterized RDD family membrane protein YckC
MPDISWHYADGNLQRGPVSLEQLRQLIRGQRIGAETLVWQEGMAAWIPAGAVPGLFLAGVAAPPFATPSSPQPVLSGQLDYSSNTEVPARLQFAGFSPRFVAILVDLLILGMPISVIDRLTMTAPPVFLPARRLGLPPIGFMFNILGTPTLWQVVVWLYFALMESSSYQATLGKMALGIKVVDMDGQRISFGRATGRFFAKYLSGILLCVGFMMAGWTRWHQALHDILAGTLVVRK